MSKLTPQQIMAIRKIADIIVDSVRAAGSHGAPAGVIYTALAHSCSLEQFQSFMSVLVSAGKLTRSGDLYRAVS